MTLITYKLSVLHHLQQLLGALQTRVAAELDHCEDVVVKVRQCGGILHTLRHAVESVGVTGCHLTGDTDDFVSAHQGICYLQGGKLNA